MSTLQPGRVPEQELALPALRRILMVTDFSLWSALALPTARLLANSFGAALSIAHASAEPEPDAQARMDRFLDDYAASRVPSILRQGAVPAVMEQIVREQGVDLVVVGTHGRSGVGKLVMGSVAQRIFNAVPCPVLSISPRGGAVRHPARILYATDFGERALRALPYALTLCKVHGAELVLLHVPPAGTSVAGYDEQLNQLMPQPVRSWCRFDTVVFPGEPADVILEVAKVQNADFIVIGASPTEGPLQSIHVPMSVAYRIVAQASCPVLRVRG